MVWIVTAPEACFDLHRKQTPEVWLNCLESLHPRYKHWQTRFVRLCWAGRWKGLGSQESRGAECDDVRRRRDSL